MVKESRMESRDKKSQWCNWKMERSTKENGFLMDLSEMETAFKFGQIVLATKVSGEIIRLMA